MKKNWIKTLYSEFKEWSGILGVILGVSSLFFNFYIFHHAPKEASEKVGFNLHLLKKSVNTMKSQCEHVDNPKRAALCENAVKRVQKRLSNVKKLMHRDVNILSAKDYDHVKEFVMAMSPMLRYMKMGMKDLSKLSDSEFNSVKKGSKNSSNNSKP